MGDERVRGLNEKKVRGAIRNVTPWQAASFSGFGLQWTLQRRCVTALCGHRPSHVVNSHLCLFLHLADRNWIVNNAPRHSWRHWEGNLKPSFNEVEIAVRQLAVEAVMLE